MARLTVPKLCRGRFKSVPYLGQNEHIPPVEPISNNGMFENRKEGESEGDGGGAIFFWQGDEISSFMEKKTKFQ